MEKLILVKMFLEYLMSWTLVYFLFVVLLFAIFSMVNLKNTCNISFLFYEFKDIPVYTAAMFSFITGTFLSLPFFIHRRRRKNKEKNPIVGNIDTVELKSDKGSSFFSWFKKKNDDNIEKIEK